MLGSVHQLTLPVAQNEKIVLVLFSQTIYKALEVFKSPRFSYPIIKWPTVVW
jgi:hypothetical protein